MNTQYVRGLAREISRNGNMGSFYMDKVADFAALYVTRDGTEATVLFKKDSVSVQGDAFGAAIYEVAQAANNYANMMASEDTTSFAESVRHTAMGALEGKLTANTIEPRSRTDQGVVSLTLRRMPSFAPRYTARPAEQLVA